jgi:PAS domain S-box-containing protein
MRAPDKSERKILIAVLSILIILSSLAYFSHENSKGVIVSALDIERSQEIKFHVEKIIAVSTDLTSGARGYVLTGDENFLEPTNKSISILFGHLDKLKAALKDNKPQLKNIDELEKAIDENISFANHIIEIRKNKSADEAFAFFSSAKGKELTDKINNIASLVMAEQNARLVAQKEENKKNIGSFNVAFSLLLLKIVITVLSVFLLLRYYFKERAHAAVTLKENKELLQTVIDNAPSMVFVKDLKGRYILANEHYETLFDMTGEQMLGKTDSAIFPKEIAEVQRGSDFEAIKEKKAVEMEEALPLKGDVKHYLTVKFPLFDENHLIYAVGGIATDITERKKFERMLKQKSDEVLSLFNNAPCGYHTINKDLIITEMNDTELQWLGYTRAEVIGKMHVYSLYSAESVRVLEQMRPDIWKRQSNSLQDIEIRSKRKDGSSFPVLVNSVILYDESGEFAQAKTALFDITLRKRTESIISQN